MYACMTPVGFDTSDKFENHCPKLYYFFENLEVNAENLNAVFDQFYLSSLKQLTTSHHYVNYQKNKKG